MSKTLTSGQPLFNDTELMRALYDVQDILERALCPFVLLQDTAQSIKERGYLAGDGVYVGVQKKHVTKQVLSTIKFYLDHSKRGTEIREDGFDYEVNGVPVHVKFITRKYKFLENLDFRFYMANEYRIPNPWDEYYRVRNLVA